MGMTAFALLLAVEIFLAVRTCRRKTEKRIWRRERLAGRALQTGIVIFHIILTAGQKWRFLPVLAFLLFLLVTSALSVLLRRNRSDGIKRPFSAVLSGIFSCLLLFIFLIPAFVFTGYSGLPVSGPHSVGRAEAILTDSSRTDPFEQDGSFREVPVHFYYPEGGGEEKYPLVVFSHGAFGYYESNTSTYMELASNGYVVAALDHPHHAFFTEDTSGSMVIVDTNFLNTALNLNSSEMDDEEEYALYRDWMDLRTADMGYAVDCIKAAAGEGAPDGAWSVSESGRAPLMSALAVTDPSRIGLMGHSMGGATSVELGRQRRDISAVIDIDGTMLGEYTGTENGKFTVREDPYPLPVLEFVNWDSYSELQEYPEEAASYPNTVLMKNAVEGFVTTIRDTKHMDYTDLPLLSPTLGKMLGSGSRGTEETMTIVNSRVLSFFNCYLKGEGSFTAEDIY